VIPSGFCPKSSLQIYIWGVLPGRPRMAPKRIDRKSNAHLQSLVGSLKQAARENEAPVWKAVAGRLESPARTWPSINISRLERHTEAKATVVVPGKLLGSGAISKPLTVGAFSFSASAREKVEAAGGSCLSLPEMLKAHPKGAGVRLMG